MKTAILIPCYNESKTIEKVVTDFKRVMPHADIYVYDNNSTDGTDKIAENAGAIVRYEYEQGKGNVVRSMFRDIEADCYIILEKFIRYKIKLMDELTSNLEQFKSFLLNSFWINVSSVKDNLLI